MGVWEVEGGNSEFYADGLYERAGVYMRTLDGDERLLTLGRQIEGEGWSSAQAEAK